MGDGSSSRAPFVPGLELSRAYYYQVVGPLLGEERHSAGLLGWGSDVLGFDTPRSTDHAWGPRVRVFLETARIEPVGVYLEQALPQQFRGWPTHFGWDQVPVTHHVYLASLEAWVLEQVGFDPRRATPQDWLDAPSQRLLEAVAGQVFHDGLGELEEVRRALAWYPHQVWLELLARQWDRLAQEESFVGRAAEVGDELGSRLIAARLVGDLMGLAFLMERRYAPYSKWFGSAFARLESAPRLGLERVLQAQDFPTREAALVEAFQAAAETFNRLGLTPPLTSQVGWFHDRPFRVLGSHRFAEACRLSGSLQGEDVLS